MPTIRRFPRIEINRNSYFAVVLLVMRVLAVLEHDALGGGDDGVVRGAPVGRVVRVMSPVPVGRVGRVVAGRVVPVAVRLVPRALKRADKTRVRRFIKSSPKSRSDARREGGLSGGSGTRAPDGHPY